MPMQAPNATKPGPTVTSHGPLPEPNQQLVPPLSQPKPGMQPLGPLPAQPPRKELQGLSIDQVNHTVDKVTQNHMRLFGTKPSPGLVFDVARGVGQGHVQNVDHLFDIPKTPMDAVVRSIPAPPEVPVVQHVLPEIQKQLDAIPASSLKQLNDLGLDPAKLLTMSADKREVYVDQALRTSLHRKQDQIEAQTLQMGLGSEFTVVGRAIGQISHSIKNIPFGIYKLAEAVGHDAYNAAEWPAYLVEKPFGVSVVGRPDRPTQTASLFKLAGKAIVTDVTHPRENPGYLAMDVFALFTAGAGGAARAGAALGRAAEVGDVAARASMAVTDPLVAATKLEKFASEREATPYSSVLKGAGERASAHEAKTARSAAKYLREGGDITKIPSTMQDVLGNGSNVLTTTAKQTAAFLKEFKKRPYNPPLKIGFGSYQAYVPTFDNYILRKLQTGFVERANITMRARHSPESEFSTVNKGRLYDSIFSPERWTKRAMDNNMAMDVALDTFDAHELTRLTTWQARAEAMKDSIMQDRDLHGAWKTAGPKNRLTIGKAIQLIFTEDPNPVATWRGHHTRAIEEARKSIDNLDNKLDDPEADLKQIKASTNRQQRIIRNHEAHLVALEKAVELIQNGHPQFSKIVDKAYDVSEQQSKIKQEMLGYDPLVMSRHSSEVAAIARGENIVRDEGGHPVGIVAAGRSADSVLGAGVRAATNELNREKRKLDTLERKLAKPSKKAGVVADRPGIRKKIEEQRAAVDAATDKLFVARHHQETLGSRVIPLNVYERGGQFDFVHEEGNTPGVGWDHPTRAITAYKDGVQVGRLSYTKVGNGKPIWREGGELPAETDKWEVLNAFVEPEARRQGVAKALFMEAEKEVGRGNLAHSGILSEDGRAFAAGVPGSDPSIEGYRKGREPGYISTRTRATGDDLTRTGRAFARITKGKYGSSKPRQTVWRMDGKTLAMGDNLLDQSDLLARELTTSVRAGVQMNQWNKIWESSLTSSQMAIKDNPHLQPIRDIRSVPAHLKKYVEAMFEQKQDHRKMEILDEEGLQKLREWMYPDRDTLLKPNDPHVRWFDERFHMDTIDKDFWMKADRLMSDIMAPINEPFRFLLIFGTPAYLLNAVGAAGTLAAKQGFLAIPNLGRSFASSRINGGPLTRFLDLMAGSTHAQALVTERNVFTKGSQAVAGSWQRATDLYFRRAAIMGRLREAGLWNDKLSPEEMLAKLRDPENRVVVRDVMQKGRNDMLDFNKMTWPEKAILRHLIFVYAFMRAGSIYSVRWLLEHPVEADVIAHVGQDRVAEIKRLVGETPSWFLNENYFPIGHDTVLNGVQLNIPDTLNQIAYPLASLGHPIPYQSTLDLLGPFPSQVQMAITGTQPGGQAVPKRTNIPLVDSFLEMFAQTPPGFFMRKRKASTPLPPVPVSSGTYDPVAAAHSQESVAIKEPTFDSNTLWNGWGEVIFRSALSRHPNQAGMAARHWRDLRTSDPNAYWQHQVDLVHQMVNEQAKAIGKPAPPEVLDAVDLIAGRERFIGDKKSAWQKKHHQPLDKVGDRQLAAWTIDYLAQSGKISPSKAASWRSALNQANDSRQAKVIWIGALRENGSKAWEQWVQKADAIDWFAHGAFPDVLASLKERKLGDFSSAASANQETKWGYGRAFHSYVDGLADYQLQISSAKRGTESTKIRADLKDYVERNDHPVVINGVTFPSPVRVAFARLSPGAQRAKVLSSAVGPWSSNDSFEKQLLTGRKPDPSVVFGYRNLAAWVDSYQAQNPGKGVPGWLKKGYVDYLSKKIPAFGQDYAFARAPLAYRLQHVKPITQSRWAPEWRQVLDLANKRAVSLKKAGYTAKGITDQWKLYDLPTVQKWIDGFPAGFRRELGQWQAAHPHFLDSLVR